MPTTKTPAPSPPDHDGEALMGLDRIAFLAHHFACLSTANAHVTEHEFTSDHARVVWELLEQSLEAIVADRNHLLQEQWERRVPEPERRRIMEALRAAANE